MGARRGGARGGTCPPLEFEKMTSYAAVLQHTLKFSLAPSALATDTLYFSVKRAKKRENFRLRLRRAEKWSIFCTARQKRVNFLKRRWFCPPLEKFLRAPMPGFTCLCNLHHRRLRWGHLRPPLIFEKYYSHAGLLRNILK